MHITNRRKRGHEDDLSNCATKCAESVPRSVPRVACKNRKNALFFKVLEKVCQCAYIYIAQWHSLANSRLQACLGVLGGRGR